MTRVWSQYPAGHTGGPPGKSIMRPTPPFGVFFVSRTPLSKFWGKMLWHLWIGRARHPGPGPNDLDIEVFIVGGFLTHGDYALETDAGFLAVVEHRLIPARVRNEWARLRRAGIWSVWSPANQDSGHVGHAGVGLISLKGAPLSLRTFATAAFATYFAHGRALRTHIPIGGGRMLHLVVVYGFQGAASDPEKLRLTDSLVDAMISELAVVASSQPCLIVGDFNVEPTKIPCLLKGISAGLWFDLQACWATANADFVVGCPLATAALRWCRGLPDRWVMPPHPFSASFSAWYLDCLVWGLGSVFCVVFGGL